MITIHIKPQSKLSISFLCLMLGMISGCASLSKQECQTGDWYGIGLSDGAKGKTPSYIQEHIKSCSKHGITSNAVKWEQGRKAGLKSYCTTANAYHIGRSGYSLSPVCGFMSSLEQNKLLRLNLEGKELYRLNQRIEKHKRELKKIEDRLEKKRKQRYRYSKTKNNLKSDSKYQKKHKDFSPTQENKTDGRSKYLIEKKIKQEEMELLKIKNKLATLHDEMEQLEKKRTL